MSDPEQPESAGLPPGGISLGLGAGGFDTTLGAAPDAAPAPEPPADEGLALPRGGLVAMRKSGGLRFTSRSVVVYRSGRVRTSGGGLGAAPGESRLSAKELARLKALILRAQLARHKASGRQPPDGYAYELAARLSRRLRTAEVYDGAIPAAIGALIEALSALF